MGEAGVCFRRPTAFYDVPCSMPILGGIFIGSLVASGRLKLAVSFGKASKARLGDVFFAVVLRGREVRESGNVARLAYSKLSSTYSGVKAFRRHSEAGFSICRDCLGIDIRHATQRLQPLLVPRSVSGMVGVTETFSTKCCVGGFGVVFSVGCYSGFWLVFRFYLVGYSVVLSEGFVWICGVCCCFMLMLLVDVCQS